MTQPETLLPKQDDFLSPVEERHIDYILEEEFSVNPDFLKFFLTQARLQSSNKELVLDSADDHECLAVRSATTEKGETDVLVTYGPKNGDLTAILIEDKIRAEFQPDQGKRYHDRGKEGKGKSWAHYWTCLVSHEKNSAHKGEFDAFVSLQALQQYFSINHNDKRRQFRADILSRTIRKYKDTGLKESNFDLNFTRIRALYAAECDNRLKRCGWRYDQRREAYKNDDWFSFWLTTWPKDVKVRHQAKLGRMDLIFPTTDHSLMLQMIEQCAAWHPNGSAPKIAVVPVGRKNTKSAFQMSVPKIADYSVDLLPFEDYFAAIEFLASFYMRCSPLFPEALRISPTPNQLKPHGDPQMHALRAMLLGFMRCTVTCHGTEMPYPLPDLQDLTSETPEEMRYFASLGLMGGFVLELMRDDEGHPYILSAYWSRQWGITVHHKISLFEIISLGEEPHKHAI